MRLRRKPVRADPFRMRMRDYHEWINSMEWRRFARRQLTRCDYHCERCGAHTTDLEVHHLHYRTFGGRETPEDVQVLCVLCHRLAHPEQDELDALLASLPGYRRRGRHLGF